jgi:hypothetical protein
VKAVQILKVGGKGVRRLGVPIVADRIAQTVVVAYLEPEVEPLFHPDSMGTGRVVGRGMRWRCVGGGAGSRATEVIVIVVESLRLYAIIGVGCQLEVPLFALCHEGLQLLLVVERQINEPLAYAG